MGCEEIRDLIASGAGGEATDHERIAIESHVAVCAECARELAEVRNLMGHLALLREGDAPPGTPERIWQGIRAAVPTRRRSRLLAWTLRAAALLVIGASVGYSTTSILRHPDPRGLPVEESLVDDARATYVPRPSDGLAGGSMVPEGTVLQGGTGYYLPKVD
ncbi:MAG TPA: zf-HC2 domain-containing protein, partial [Planctomycetota bacterium]